VLEAYNREFHIALISGCKSRWLLHFHRMMYDQSLRYRMLAFRVKNFPRDQSRREHKQILEAALARDVDALLAVLGTHITKGSEMYAEHEADDRAKARRKAKR
jgi:DNA-binding GntR family transcriptional regulator